MRNLLETREIGDCRISVYQDECAENPCTTHDLLGRFLWSGDSTWKFLRELICGHVSQNRLIAYLKKGRLSTAVMKYDRHDNVWQISYCSTRGSFCCSVELAPDDLKYHDIRREILEPMDEDELAQILCDLATDLAFCEWSSVGYSPGEYACGYAWCDKARFSTLCDTDTKNWRERAVRIMQSESEIIGMWMWGDVIGYVLEKKTNAGGESDWVEYDSCWDFYLSPDELIGEVIARHGLQSQTAA